MKVKVLVKSVKNPSGQIALAPTKDTVIVEVMTDEGLRKGTLIKDKVFYSVSPVTWSKMIKPKTIYVWYHLGKIYCEPLI